MELDVSSFSALSVAQSDIRPTKLLRPFHAIRNMYDRRTILVLAAENCLNVPEDLKTFTEGDSGVHVRFTTKLPLSNPDAHPPIDVVVLVYKVFNKDSLKTIRDSIRYIDVRYLVEKCFILATSDVEFSLADVYEIEAFANSYQLPIHYVLKMKNPDGKGLARLQLPSSLMSVYCPPIRSDVNSLIINAAITRGSRLLEDASTTQ